VVNHQEKRREVEGNKGFRGDKIMLGTGIISREEKQRRCQPGHPALSWRPSTAGLIWGFWEGGRHEPTAPHSERGKDASDKNYL